MGGGPLYQNNNIPGPTYPYTEVPEQQASYEQQQQQQQYLAEQSRKRQEYQRRSNYNPFLNQQPNWTSQSASSFAPVYPSYDPTEFQVDPVPLSAPVLPPVPAAYRTPSTSVFINPPSVSISPEVASHRTPPSVFTRPEPENEPIPTNKNQVRLIYTKSGFYLKSTNPMVNQSIHGFLAIFSKSMENVDICMGWIPEYLIEPHDIAKLIELDGTLASDHGFPKIDLNMGQAETMIISLKNTHSLYVCPPSMAGQGSIVITAKSGDVMKPIWYSADNNTNDLQVDLNNWPGYDIIDIINAFCPLQSSAETQFVHLVGIPTIITSPKPASISQPSISSDPIIKAVESARWSLLERLSKITQYSRDTAAQVFSQAFQTNNTVRNTVNEYQMASQYLQRWGTHANPENEYYLMDDTDGLLHGMPEISGPTPIHTRREPVSPEEWITLFDQDGRLSVSTDVVKHLVFQSGLDSDIRIEAWKFLLGVYPWKSTFDEREAIRRSRAEAYYSIKAKWFDNMEIRNSKEFKDEKHRIDKDVHRTDRSQEAFVGEDLPNPDLDMCVGTNANLEIMKDILVTYNYHNTDLGYVQGMSDLLAPLFVAMGDEAMAFWVFSLFMERMQSNFYIDQSGMHGQLKTLDGLIRFMDPVLYKRLEETETSNLFFCFRWLLVWFKREFEWEDVIRLWEVLWTDHLSDKMVLFIALAVIDAHRDVILKELNQFDEILKYINDLTGNIPLEPTLQRAEVLFYQFESKIRAMQHKKSLLEDQLQIRSVWNSSERVLIQERIEKLQIPDRLLSLLKQ
ncbi:rab-GTPase-TBC domain-containing protein [Thamnidium elegans]|nr:rab-GTPase-TBC domain-containing protein [Thamnidium elegans]